MTNEQFSREYHLLDRLSQGAVVTHHAQSASGAMVMVHFLRASSDENAAIVRELDALMPERRARILTVVDVDGVTAIVTKFMLDFTSFQDWLASGARPAPTPREVSTATSRNVDATPSPEPGEFTQFFNGVAGTGPLQEPGESRPAASAPTDVAKTPGEPGEFTLFFRGAPSAGASQPSEQNEPVQPARSGLSPAQQAGDFTQMFGAPISAADQPKTSGAEAAPKEEMRTAEPAQRAVPPTGPLGTLPLAELSAFPRLESPAPPSVGPTFQPSWSAVPSPEPPTPPSGPGEYTRFFGGAPAPPVAPVPTRLPPPSAEWESAGLSADLPIASTAGDSYFQRLAGGPAPASNLSPAPPQNAPPAPPAFSGPSEFTRVISGPPSFSVPTPPGPRPPVPPPPVAPSGKSAPPRDRILLFSLIATVILAVVLVVVLVIAT